MQVSVPFYNCSTDVNHFYYRLLSDMHTNYNMSGGVVLDMIVCPVQH